MEQKVSAFAAMLVVAGAIVAVAGIALGAAVWFLVVRPLSWLVS